MRCCLNCGSSTTYISKGKYPHEVWLRYENGFLCKRCHKKIMYIPHPRPQILRSCINCNSVHSKINRSGSQMWYSHNESWYCDKCNTNLFKNPVYHSRQMMFVPLGKQIILKENPKTGQCMLCFKKVGDGVKRTSIHHIQYHSEDPLRDTIELCNSCHRIVHTDELILPISN